MKKKINFLSLLENWKFLASPMSLVTKVLAAWAFANVNSFGVTFSFKVAIELSVSIPLLINTNVILAQLSSLFVQKAPQSNELAPEHFCQHTAPPSE